MPHSITSCQGLEWYLEMPVTASELGFPHWELYSWNMGWSAISQSVLIGLATQVR